MRVANLSTVKGPEVTKGLPSISVLANDFDPKLSFLKEEGRNVNKHF